MMGFLPKYHGGVIVWQLWQFKKLENMQVYGSAASFPLQGGG